MSLDDGVHSKSVLDSRDKTPRWCRLGALEESVMRSDSPWHLRALISARSEHEASANFDDYAEGLLTGFAAGAVEERPLGQADEPTLTEVRGTSLAFDLGYADGHLTGWLVRSRTRDRVPFTRQLTPQDRSDA